MEKQRRPGRPRQEAERKQYIGITLSVEAVRYLEGVTVNRSAFIEALILAHKAARS